MISLIDSIWNTNLTRLFQEIEPTIWNDVREQRKQPILIEKQTMEGVWNLCNTTSMRAVSLPFGNSQPTVFYCVHDFSDTLCVIQDQIIFCQNSNVHKNLLTTLKMSVTFLALYEPLTAVTLLQMELTERAILWSNGK
jgi:hypothetical protein